MDDAATRIKQPGSGVPAEYRPLHKYLAARYVDCCVLTFAQIEDLLGHALPTQAYVEPIWWANADESGGHSPQATSWVLAHRVATANLRARAVRFDRGSN